LNAFTGNRAKDKGGALFNSGSLTLRSTLLSNNIGPSNCFGTIKDGGGNLNWPASDSSCPGIQLDPRLGLLQDNGGMTKTMALLNGSAAIYNALQAFCPLIDQRGLPRGENGLCDIGAFENIWIIYAPMVRK
jgi:predicted outer membrane repeat protein